MNTHIESTRTLGLKTSMVLTMLLVSCLSVGCSYDDTPNSLLIFA